MTNSILITDLFLFYLEDFKIKLIQHYVDMLHTYIYPRHINIKIVLLS